MHDLAILEDELQCLLQLHVLFLFTEILLLPLLGPPRIKLALFFQFCIVLDLLLQFLIGLGQFDLDEVDLLLGFFQVLLDAALLVGDLVLQGEEGVVGVGVVLAPHKFKYNPINAIITTSDLQPPQSALSSAAQRGTLA